MSLLQWVQDTALSTALRESTWGFPILGALHVLCLAWFGGAVLIADPQFKRWKHIGLAAILLTGALLFCVEPLKCNNSAAFRVKMALLLLLALTGRSKRPAAVSIALWAAVIAAARGIAFF